MRDDRRKYGDEGHPGEVNFNPGCLAYQLHYLTFGSNPRTSANANP